VVPKKKNSDEASDLDEVNNINETFKKAEQIAIKNLCLIKYEGFLWKIG